MPDERLDQVRLLRERGLTPKQIARTIGISTAEAGRLVRTVAITAQAGAEPALVGCWISPTWRTGLTLGDHPDRPRHEDDSVGTDGLVSVLVARKHRHDTVSVCGYLADVYCLGVKEVFGPETMDDVGLRRFRDQFFDAYFSDPLAAPIELACEIVFGSVEYALGLGFDPHPGFAAVQGHLGTWHGPSTITFGKNGKPLFISGPHDSPLPIIRTLERTAGAGNFDYIAVAG
jgi:hypothetical protein